MYDKQIHRIINPMPYPYHKIILYLDRETPLCKDLIRYIIGYVKYEKLDDDTIKQAVKNYYNSSLKNTVSFTYGTIEYWDLKNVSCLRGLFSNMQYFDEDISEWNVGNVIDMSFMFYSASNFNGDLSRWDVKNVINMSYMFCGAISFNKNISKWDVGRVEDMNHMFFQAQCFNGDLSEWNVGSVKNMQAMFKNAYSFSRSIHMWNIHRVTNMIYMFEGAHDFKVNLASWRKKLSMSVCVRNMFHQSGMDDRKPRWYDERIRNLHNVINPIMIN